MIYKQQNKTVPPPQSCGICDNNKSPQSQPNKSARNTWLLWLTCTLAQDPSAEQAPPLASSIIPAHRMAVFSSQPRRFQPGWLEQLTHTTLSTQQLPTALLTLTTSLRLNHHLIAEHSSLALPVDQWEGLCSGTTLMKFLFLHLFHGRLTYPTANPYRIKQYSSWS